MERIGIELEEAVRIITEAIQPILETEMVTLEEAGGISLLTWHSPGSF